MAIMLTLGLVLLGDGFMVSGGDNFLEPLGMVVTNKVSGATIINKDPAHA